MRRSFVCLVALLAAIGLSDAARAEESVDLLQPHWSFDGPFGTFDRAALQRGFQVYKEVCSSCHALSLLFYRNLGGPGGPGFGEDEVKAIAAGYKVQDGPNDQGEMFERAGRPSDPFVKPFPNEKAARAGNNGAYPPDLSLITKAREGGANYVYSILNGYGDLPQGFKLNEGMNYNKYFAAGEHQIAMPQPLQPNQVTYSDGTQASLQQEAHDVVTFLAWASEPELEARKRIGLESILFLIVLTVLLYAVKRKVWAAVH
jgi:ubiquinol-cytochrome c reductase cytochrome c1 subunit